MDPVAASPGRTVSGALGATVAAIALVMATAYGAESRAEIDDTLARLDATRISVTSGRSTDVSEVFDRSVMRRVRGTPGIRAAGLVVALGSDEIHGPNGTRIDAPVYALGDGALQAVGASVGVPDPRFRMTAVAGVGLARALNVAPLATSPSIRVGGSRRLISGYVDRARAVPQLLGGVGVSTCCGRLDRTVRDAELVVGTTPGITDEVADKLPALVDPLHPETVTVAVDSSPNGLRRNVQETVRGVTTIIALAALIVGLLVNGLVRYIAVRERQREFGLRAALGARRSDVLLQITAESTIVAALGASVGVLLGVAAAAVLAQSTGHPLGATPEVCVLALAAGVLSGVVSGLVPAVVAARVSPAAALRS